MKLFGLEIKRTRNDFATGGGQLERASNAQGPYTAVFNEWIARKVQPSLYEAMREAIPVVDVAILRLVTLDGLVKFDGANKGLIHEIEDWAGTVKVNDMQTGLQAFINNYSNETYEQGFSISEFVASQGLDDVARLNVADSKDIIFKRTDKGLETWYKGRSTPKKSRSATELIGDILADNLSVAEASTRLGAAGYALLNPENMIYYSIDNENHGPYGVSLLRSTEFVSKILLTIQNATLNTWERFGDPAYAVTYKTSRRDLSADTLETRRSSLGKSFNDAIAAKRAGKSADFINAIDKDSEIKIEVIGHEGQVLEIEAPARHVLEQIVARFRVPAWLLGFHWSTTERLAQYESEILLTEAETRGANKIHTVKKVVEAMLKLRGRKWKRGDFEVYFDLPNLHDLVAQAQARFLNAQADMYETQYGKPGAPVSTPVPDPAKRGKNVCHCEPKAKQSHKGTKESRPIPHVELDKVEDELLAKMEERWKIARAKVSDILKLKEFAKRLKAEDPTDRWNLTEEQKAALRKTLDEFAEGFNPVKDGDEIFAYAYGRAYSLGALQAISMTGVDEILLDIANSRVFQKLVDAGFDLVKENTRDLKMKILSEIEAQVLAGTNPAHVAYRLSGIFDNASSNWERLVRSEMTMAAERGKLDEFEAEGVEKVEFIAAADACPICQAVAGFYDIGEVPLPVRDTHPRCYCTLASSV